MSRYQFAPDSAFTKAMAAGHFIRKGHELKGVWVYTAPGLRQLSRTCCTEPSPGRDTNDHA